jgi:ubiquinone/menaquinone biosynthesis C-methylase UbiE
MNALFDTASHSYDTDFTDTLTGRLQRNRVWKYLDQQMTIKKPLQILELNCGTGEDAIHFARSGHVVVATDISEEMLSRANEKVKEKEVSHKVHLEKVDLKNLGVLSSQAPFDLIFSNFGGLNCLAEAEITDFKINIRKLLKPKGKLVLVIMPDFCLWESLYFLSKLKMKEVFRRKKASVMADVSGVKVETWYYSPGKLSRLLRPEFSTIRAKPVGFFAPPSYLDTFMKRHPSFFRFLSFLENRFSRFSWQSAMADHYYLELQAR